MKNIDWNLLVNKVLEFVLSYFRPSLAKLIIWPLLISGLSFLNPPFWVEVLNWALENQNLFPQFNAPIAAANHVVGGALILLSLLVYCFETIVQYKKFARENPKIGEGLIEGIPDETSKKITELLTDVGFTAPHLQDASVEKHISEIKEFRFFSNYSRKEACKKLGDLILEGELRGASPPIKAKALALLSRYIGLDNITLGRKYLNESRRLTSTEEADIAEAFIIAAEGYETDAIGKLLTKPTPLKYSAVFMLKRIKQKNNDAINWLYDSGLSIESLDSDGQQSLLNSLLQAEEWDKALDQVDKLGDLTQIKSIGLCYTVAVSLMTNSVNILENRRNIIQEVPFAAKTYPLADDAKSVELRLKAAQMFSRCSELVDCDVGKDIAILSSQYSLWLRLRTPETREEAYRELRSYFSEYSIDSLKLLPLAFSFGLDLDYDRLEKEVEKLSVLYGETNSVAGLARFILAHNRKNFTQVLEYIRTHRAQIEHGVRPSVVTMLEVEALARCGLSDEASTLLETDELLSDEQKVLLKSIIASCRGEDPIALAIEQYKKSNTASDLDTVVKLLAESGIKNEFLSYAKKLFEITKSEVDAMHLANAYTKNQKFDELSEFLEVNKEIVERSIPLKFHKAWVFFRAGDLNNAKNIAEELAGNKTFDIESLEININIFSGNWDALAVIVENRWEKRDKLSRSELLQTANIAKAQQPNRAKEILGFATEKYPDDPEVLASAYITATSLGWEENNKTSHWINRAAALSSEKGGPIKTGSLEDIKELIHAKSEEKNRVYKAYLDNEAPILLLADLLNRSLSDFYLLQPFENKKNKATHKKSAIAAFHSARKVEVIYTDSITVDVSSILTLGYLGLLEYFFQLFKKILIPHSLLRWLYEEKQKVAFHQPSQISKAKTFEGLISDGFIQATSPQLIQDPKLAISVGDELAMLLEIAISKETAENQCLVVSSYPVYKAGSLRQEQVDLSTYHENLISCPALIMKLKELSLLTETEFQQAIQYLNQQQHGQFWPEEPDLGDSASVYLDSLSVTYLMELGVLDKFQETGIKLFIHHDDANRYKNLRSFDSTIQKTDSVLNTIKEAFHNGLKSGQVMLSEMLANPDEGNRIDSAPIAEIFHKKVITGGVLIDDRTINQNLNIQIGEHSEPVFTTLDVLETLHDKGFIDEESKYANKAKLRESGFGVIFTTREEVQFHLNRSSVKDGTLRPCKELLLIKQHLSLLKISGLIKLPRDAHWLQLTLKLFSGVLKEQWCEDISIEECIAKSNWLYELIDFRSWAQCHEIRNEDGIGYYGESIRVNMLLVSNELDGKPKKLQYDKWLNDYVLQPLKNKDTESFNTVVASSKDFIERGAKQNLDEVGGKNMGKSSVEKADIAAYLLTAYPDLIRSEILKDHVFCEEIGVVSDASITFGDSKTTFSRAVLMSGVRQAYISEAGIASVKCEKGNNWDVFVNSEPSIGVRLKGQAEEFMTDIFWPLNPDSNIKKMLFEKLSNRYGLSSVDFDYWNSVLASDLSDDDVSALTSELKLTPAYLEEILAYEVKTNGTKIETLVPDNIKYYERLIGVYSGSANIIEYSDNELKEHLINKDLNYFDFIVCANFSVSNALHQRALSELQFKSIIKNAIAWQNPLMLIGCLEVGLTDRTGTFEEELQKIFDCLMSQETNEQLQLLSSLFVFIDGELSRLCVFKGKPIFYRRFAALGQASLISKIVKDNGGHFKDMQSWAMEQRGLHFFCQGFIDLRHEPRWLPGYSSVQQFRDELNGRISIALNKCDHEVFAEKLQQILSKDNDLPLSSFYSGPLEGNLAPSEIPDEIRISLEEKLTGEASPDAFNALINLTRICKVDLKYADLAASLLERAQYQIEGKVNKDVVYHFLNGLATVAAALRSKKLAASVMILARVYRDYLDINDSSESILAVGLVSAASFEKLEEWAEYVGQWAYEIATLDLNEGARKSLLSMISQLCILEPFLYYTCARAIEILGSSS